MGRLLRRNARPAPQAQAGQCRNHHGAQLPCHARYRQGQGAGQTHQQQPGWSTAQAATHAPHGLRHHRYGGHLQTMQHACGHQSGGCNEAQAQQCHDQCRGQGKAQPGCQGPGEAALTQAQRHAHLAARRAGQKLAQGHQIGIVAFTQPAPARHELRTEIGQVRHRPAK